MNPFRKLLHILSWIVFGSFLVLFFMIPSLVVVPLMLLISREKNNRDVPKWFPWGNFKEGCPDWWLTLCAKPVTSAGARKWRDQSRQWFPRFWWFVVRNPVNNSRYWFKDRVAKLDTNWDHGTPMEAQQMLDANVERAYRWAYSGVFAGYRVVWIEEGTYSERWFGWKVGSTVDGMGFATQNRRHIEIGQ